MESKPHNCLKSLPNFSTVHSLHKKYIKYTTAKIHKYIDINTQKKYTIQNYHLTIYPKSVHKQSILKNTTTYLNVHKHNKIINLRRRTIVES